MLCYGQNYIKKLTWLQNSLFNFYKFVLNVLCHGCIVKMWWAALLKCVSELFFMSFGYINIALSSSYPFWTSFSWITWRNSLYFRRLGCKNTEICIIFFHCGQKQYNLFNSLDCWSLYYLFFISVWNVNNAYCQWELSKNHRIHFCCA